MNKVFFTFTEMNFNHPNPDNLGVTLFNAFSKKHIPFFKNVFIGVFVCFFGTAMAQHRSHEALTYGGGSSGGSNFESGYAISLGVGYDLPLGYLKDIYKPGVAFNFGVMRFMGDFTLSLNAGYHAYKPKDDAFGAVEITDNSENATATVENMSAILGKFKVYSGYASIVYNVNIAEGARLYGGANLGGYYTYNIEPYILDNGDYGFAGQHVSNFYVAPRLGVIFAFTDHIGLSLESTYNFFTPINKSKYKTSSGTFYTSVAGLGSIIYKF
ncbi:MAG: hypothetical protein JWR38_4007 [Mucilaginibacter sp.]|nr:hypothetical protein [Mucilaginibacter sp.]